MHKSDDDDKDDDYNDLKRSGTNVQYTHIWYFQSPNLPHIKTFL